jgi:hypothetical protein
MPKPSLPPRRLAARYPPSPPCSCAVCLAYCVRPGWWTVDEAAAAIEAGLAFRMMLELAPDGSFAVLSPAFKGCEGTLALQQYARAGCTFLRDERCELHGGGHMPLECRYCHHARRGRGQLCHADIEKDWNTPEGRALVEHWGNVTGLKERMRLAGGM